MSKILLSIKPEYAHLILEGSKKYEYRKHLGKAVSKIVIYATSPEKMIIGEVDVVGCLEMNKTDLWEKTKSASGITRAQYRNYFKDCSTACAYILGDTRIYVKPKTLGDYGLTLAPQSFVYLAEDAI